VLSSEVAEPFVALPEESPPVDAELVEDETQKDQRRKIQWKDEVEWLDFERFKNRHSEEEGLAIIEILGGHPRIAQEVERETARRDHGERDILGVHTRTTQS
jgi:hypothetical protein